MPFSPSAQYAKNADTFVQCSECGRWRCLYSKKKLTAQQKICLNVFLEDHDYCCGATFNMDDDAVSGIFVNGGLTCNTVMEKPFYNACKDIVCFECGSEELVTDKKDNTYPLCSRCVLAGKKYTKKASRKVAPKEV